MPITAGELHLRLSTTAGAAGNTNAPGAAGTSLGKYISNADFTDAVLNNLFPDATGDENASSNVDYQCLFVYNADGSITWQNAVAWLVTEVSGGSNIVLGVDTTAATAVGGAPVQALTIANKNTAPAGVTFGAAGSQTTKLLGISLGNIAPGFVKAIWVQRSCTNSAAVNNDGCQLRIEGDTIA